MGILSSFPTPIFDINTSVTQTSAQNQQTPVLVANYLAHILIALAIPVAVAAILYSAYVLMTGNGDPAAYNKVKKNLLYVLTGAAIMVFSGLIFNAVAGFFH